MFTIDLLKGEGIPIRSRPGGIAFACTVISVPLIVGIIMAGVCIEHRVALSIQEQQLARIKSVTGTLLDALARKHAMEAQKTASTNLLYNAKTALTRHTPWTPALLTLVEGMPDNLVLTKLEAQQDFVRRRVPAENDPGMMIDITVPVRTLEIDVCGYDGNVAYRAVRELQDHLKSSAALGSRLNTVTVSQGSGILDGQDVVSYELSCVFKPIF